MGPGELLAGDGHLADEQRACMNTAARIDIVPESNDVAVHIFEVSRDGDLVYGIRDRTVLHPEAARAAGIIARHPVHTLSHELGHQQSGAEPAQERLAVETSLRAVHQQVVNSTGVTGGLQSQAPRRVAAEHVAIEHTRAYQLAVVRGRAFLVERTAGKGAGN